MAILKLLKSFRREFNKSAIRVFVAGTAIVVMPVVSVADEPLVTKSGRFEIPFDIDAEPGRKPEGFAVLFGSQDGGRTWAKLNTVPADSRSFTFSAPRDGRYAFAIRTTDAQGNLQQTIEGSAPELEVVVDTVAPEIRLDLIDAGNGQVLINWTTRDASILPQTLNLEFADGSDGGWKPVRFSAAASGQAAVQVSASSVVSVRAAVQDAAGNQGEASTQLILRAANSATNIVPGSPSSRSNPAPLGPSPFPGMNSVAENAPLSSSTLTIPSVPGSSANVVISSSAAGFPQIQSGQASSGYPPAQSTYPVSPEFNAVSPLPVKEAAFQTAAGAQIVNFQVFDLEYQVDDVGPSGVSAVDLFITEDGGKQWFSYGNDEDLRSPIQIDTQGEGTFGFAVRVRNGLGFADDPPQPGQVPEMVVTVDKSIPVIELAQPVMRTDGFGTIQLSWQVREQNPAGTPVRLEYAAAPNGPWTPVFDWQYDQGGYQWGVRPGTPTQLYFRLLARDAAGNIATAQTNQPVVVDLRRPVGRLLRVQTVSQSGLSNQIQP